MGEITTEASVGGRRITLQPLMQPMVVPVVPKRVESSIPAGFQMEWLSGDDGNGVTFELTVGAGMGSVYMVLTLNKDGQEFGQEVIDIRDVVKSWLQVVLAQGPTDGRQSSWQVGAEVEMECMVDEFDDEAGTQWVEAIVEQVGENDGVATYGIRVGATTHYVAVSDAVMILRARRG